MSGSESTTAARTIAMTAALISLVSIVGTFLLRDLFEDRLHGADRLWQRLPYLV